MVTLFAGKYTPVIFTGLSVAVNPQSVQPSDTQDTELIPLIITPEIAQLLAPPVIPVGQHSLL